MLYEVITLGHRQVVALLSEGARPGIVSEGRVGFQVVEHFMRVRLAVGGQAQRAARGQLFREHRHKSRFDQPPLDVPFFGPGSYNFV